MVAGTCAMSLFLLQRCVAQQRGVVEYRTLAKLGRLLSGLLEQAATHYDLNANGVVSVEEFRLALNEYVPRGCWAWASVLFVYLCMCIIHTHPLHVVCVLAVRVGCLCPFQVRGRRGSGCTA